MNIRLDKKYGLNPIMTTCFYCGEAKDIMLIGKASNKMVEMVLCSSDGEMKHNIGVIDKEPCSKCKKYMDRGIILISIKNGESGDNPYRTGGWVIVKESVIRNIMSGGLANDVLTKRVCFIEDEVWDKLELPREKRIEYDE